LNVHHGSQDDNLTDSPLGKPSEKLWKFTEEGLKPLRKDSSIQK
jgi:hypothetical protein